MIELLIDCQIIKSIPSNNDLVNKLDKTENLIILQIMPLEVINYQFYYLAEVIEKSKFTGDLPN